MGPVRENKLKLRHSWHSNLGEYIYMYIKVYLSIYLSILSGALVMRKDHLVQKISISRSPIAFIGELPVIFVLIVVGVNCTCGGHHIIKGFGSIKSQES